MRGHDRAKHFVASSIHLKKRLAPWASRGEERGSFLRQLDKPPVLAFAIQGCHRRKFRSTTRRDPHATPAPDLLDRNFTAPSPHRVWVADITYVPTWAGFLYVGIILDVYTRMIVGWSMRNDLGGELVTDALDMAVHRRRPQPGGIHHSDQGSQYASLTFGRRLREAELLASMGSVGDCFDNAMAEAFFATLETELIDRQTFRTRTEARIAVFDYIEGFYNRTRREA